MKRSVSAIDWDLTQLSDVSRRQRLLDVITPDEVADAFVADVYAAANAGLLRICWEEACERPGYFRVAAQIPVSGVIFDRLFNGRSGYRAQYYLSPEEGIMYNRQLIDRLVSPIELAYEQSPIGVSFELLKRTMMAPHAKIWIFDEQSAFNEAAPDTLNPPRWIENNATRGRSVPLPTDCIVDLKGTFLNPINQELFVDDLKLERACDLHRKGYT